jgi:hypothetical protein
MHARSSARHTVHRAVLAAVLAGAAVAVPAQGAHAQEILAFEVGGTGTLVAGGAGVSVPVTLTCTATTTDYIAFTFVPQLIQRRGKTIVGGSSFNVTAVCDGTPHNYDVLVTAFTVPFKPGDAIVQASAAVFQPDVGGEQVQVQQVIRLRN